MTHAFQVQYCSPDDALFTAPRQTIYGSNDVDQPNSIICREHLVGCLVVTKEDTVVGRVAVYLNAALTHAGKPVAQLGNFECINDVVAAQTLLAAGINEAKAVSAAFVIGPMNGSTWNDYRFITKRGQTPIFFTEQSHPDYYPGLWEMAGFQPFQEYISNIAPVHSDSNADDEFFRRHNLILRGIETTELEHELQALYPLCMQAFMQSPLFSPITSEAFVARYAVLKPLVSGAFTKLVSDEAGQPLAFVLCLPDLYDTSRSTLIMKTVAKHPALRVSGAIPALYNTIMAEAQAAGYKQIVHAFMHEDNNSLKRSQQFAGEAIRRYTLYIHAC